MVVMVVVLVVVVVCGGCGGQCVRYWGGCGYGVSWKS